MKIVYISGVVFGLELLSSILENKWNISAVFCYDDSKKKTYSDFASFDEITKRYDITHVKVHNINDEKNIQLLNSIKPDIILVMGWSQILKNQIRKIPRIGTIGTHPTELPKYRGRAPIPWSIIKGLKKSALTFFWMEEGIDDGDILDQQMFDINEEDDATSVYRKITELGKKMLVDNLLLLEKGNIRRTKQDNSKFIEYWPKRTPEDGKIDWSRPAIEIHSLIRATTYPYPGAFTFFKNTKLKIWKADCINENSDIAGKIMDVGNYGVKVGTGDGCIILKKVSINNEGDSPASTKFSESDIGIIMG